MVTKMSIFLCGHGNFMIGRSFVEAVSGLKITCNSLDPPEYPLSSEHERPGGSSVAEHTWSHSYAEQASSRESRRGVVVVPTKVLLQPLVTRVLPSTAYHASPMN